MPITMDTVDKETRSRMMAGIRSSNTKPEVLTRKALHQLGYRFRLDSKIGKIKPDIVLRSYRVCVFVHGCYWHKHAGCKLAYSDRNYSDQWKKKFADNRQRDQRVLDQLMTEEWRVAVIWECATRNNIEFEKIIKQLNEFILTKTDQYYESSYHEI